MDFNAIKSMQRMRDSNAQVLTRRQADAEERLNFGLACLEYGYEESFKRPEVLQEAAGALIDAMTLNRRDPRPSFSLAYLFFLIDDLNTAQEYLHLALSIDPEEPICLAFQDTLHEEILRQRSATKGTTVKAEDLDYVTQNSEAELDHDALYDRLEQELVQILQKLSSQTPPKVASSPLEYKSLKGSFKQMRQHYENFAHDLEIADKEIDCDELRQKLSAYEQFLNRYREIMITSESLMQLGRDLRAEVEMVKQVIAEAEKASVSEDLRVLEENLETLLDHCDGFADRLDAFAEQGCSITVAQQIYTQLVSSVEQLQDITDHLAEELTVLS